MRRRGRAEFRLAWLAVSRRKKRTIISAVLLAFVIGSSITIGSTIQQFPSWVFSLTSSSSPSVFLAYEKNSSLVGLLPVNSTIPMSDYLKLRGAGGISSVTPLIMKELPTSLSSNPSLIIGLDINFWQLGLGLSTGHWPEPNTSEAVLTVASSSDSVPKSVSVNGQLFSIVGVAQSADLVLVHSIILSYSTAQRVFSLEGDASVLVIQLSSSADPSNIAGEITAVDPSLATIDLSVSGQLLSTVSHIVGAISGAIIIVDGIFAFVILATLTISGINSRRWEYGLISSYGTRGSTFMLVLYENWIVFLLAILPAFALGAAILGYFTFYFNSLFGISVSGFSAFSIGFSSIINMSTLWNFLAAFGAATLGTFLAVRLVVLPKLLGPVLSDSH